MLSWNDKCKDSTYIERLRSQDPRAFISDSYLFVGTQLNADVTCSFGEYCLIHPYSGKGEIIEEEGEEGIHSRPLVYSWIFCFSCNGIFHAHCQGFSTEEFKALELQEPFRCKLCKEEPNNPSAIDFYALKDEIDLRITRRRETFIKVIDLSKSGIHDESMMSNVNEEIDKMRKEFEKQLEIMRLRCESVKAQRDEAMQTLNAHKKELDEMKQFKQEFATFKAQMQEASRGSNVNMGASTSHNISRFNQPADKNFRAVTSPVNSTRSNIDVVDAEKYLREPGQSVRNVQQNVDRLIPGSAPMSKPRKSFIDDIDVNNLTQSDRITLEQAQAQMEATQAQIEIASSQNLSVIRKALPNITRFDGDPRKWIQFKRDVDRYQQVGRYDEYEMRIHVFKALDGLALSRVQGSIDKVRFSTTMNALQKCFGEPARIIDQCAKDILSLKIPRYLCKDDVLLITSKIQEYFAACHYADVECANSNQLATHIFDQLNLMHKQLFRQRFKSSTSSHAFRLIELDILFDFLEDLADDLEDKKIDERKSEERKKPFQINFNAIPNSSSSSFVKSRAPDDFMFEIKDMKVNPLGYNMAELILISKSCDCCLIKGHYTVQCRKYRAMNPADRLKFVNSNGICRNCVITSAHKSFECTLKLSCGMREKGESCLRKHHISLHKAMEGKEPSSFNFKNKYSGNGSGGSGNARGGRTFRRNNTRFNQRKAEKIVNESQHDKTKAVDSDDIADKLIDMAPTLSEMPTQQVPHVTRQVGHTAIAGSANSSIVATICNVNDAQNIPDFQRTVKVFKNKFLGDNIEVIGYSVGDSAAEVTLLREDLRELLGLNGVKCEMTTQWIDGSIRTVEAMRVDMTIQGISKNCEKLVLRNCYSVPNLNLPPRSLNMEELKTQFPYLRDIPFSSYSNVSPSLLIGSTHASVIECEDKLIEGGEGNPVGIKAKLGWSVYGGCPETHSIVPYLIESIYTVTQECKHSKHKISNEELYDLYSNFCSIESLGIGNKTKHNTEQEQKALDTLKRELRILSNGSVEVPLLWNYVDEALPSIPNNFAMVYKRQVAHEIKLSKNPELHKAFNDIFKSWLTDEQVRPAISVDLDNEWPNIGFLPMSLVCNSNKDPPKYRIVFDASAKYHGTSLNGNLLKGPDLLVDLTKPLLRMRENKIAFTADIKNMFMQIKIGLRDQQMQRVLFRRSMDEEFKVFIFTSMLFGPTSSPFTSQYVKNETAERFKGIYYKAAETIQQYMYMDDLLTSEKSVKSAITRAKQCIEIFESINWKLISFQSNSAEFLKALPQANICQESIPLLESEAEACVTKVLGCVWDTKSDTFIYKFDKNLFIKIVKDCQHLPTKRDQCSTVARIFDVLGLIACFVIRGKILLQRSWIEGIDWDQKISEKAHMDWLGWLNEIENIAKLKINRRFNMLENLSECENIELHTFADAGGEAFAAVSYLVTTVRDKKYSNIVLAKAKVTPIRHKSRTVISEMPRLELCACLIASRLGNVITKHYSHIPFKRFFWSDSEIVLRWILKPNHKLLKYAISPIEEILNRTSRSEWRYVPSKLNVADIATKFQKFDFSDSNSTWFKGPDFIRLSEREWPAMPHLLEPPMVNSSVMVNATNVCDVMPMSIHKLPPVNCPIMNDNFIDKLKPSIRNDWMKLVRATARALNIIMDGLIPLIKSKEFRNEKVRNEIRNVNEGFEYVCMNDRERAEHFLIRKAQREAFCKEYDNLKKDRHIDNRDLKQLNVFLDSQGLIRINSRVAYSYEAYPQQYAPLIPRKHYLTKVFLTYVHEMYDHKYIETQIAFVRSRYWIPQIRAALKSIQFNCNECNLRNAKPMAPKMAPLPECRSNPANNPFETVGLDCMGPFHILNYNRPKKVWVLIFTCALTRFIHLRILTSLESIKVLEAIAEFWTSHGPIRTFISDRGTNFVGAKNVLDEDKKATMNFLARQHKLISQEVTDKYSVDWKLLPAHSPWMGAFYERMIREVKRSIASVLDDRKLTAPVLNIALNDAAHRINNRPLTHNSVSADDEPVLTPHMLAKGRSGFPYLPGVKSCTIKEATQDRSIYRRGRAIADEIMRRFYHQYLPVLTKRVKWNKDIKPLKAGDLVLLIEPNDTRKEWRRGKIIKVYKGRDGRCRVADVLLPDKSLKKARSIQRLAKIEIKSNEP